MQDESKKRLAGAVVLVVLVVIFVPMFFEGGSVDLTSDEPPAPPEPAFDSGGYELPPLPQVEPLSDPDSLAATEQDGTSDNLALSENPEAAAEDASETGAVENARPTNAAPEAVTPPSRPVRAQPKPQPAEPAKPAPRPAPKPAPAPAEKPPRKEPSTPAPRTDLAPPPVPDESAWIVQVASLSSAGSANALASKLRASGFNAFVEQARVNGKTWHRVRVGPVTEHGVAKSLEARLRGQQGLETLIQRYR